MKAIIEAMDEISAIFPKYFNSSILRLSYKPGALIAAITLLVPVDITLPLLTLTLLLYLVLSVVVIPATNGV